jgi:hypothetical protein
VLVSGIEFSSKWNGIGVHVVGLNIDPDSDAIQTGVRQQQQARRERAEKIAEKLEKAGLENVYQGAKILAGDREIYRPDFASYMVQSGFCKNTEQAFKKYLGAGKAGDIKQGWADIQTVIDWIHEAGGIAVLAHPHKYKLTRTKLLQLVTDFQMAGGFAMEVLSGAENKNISDMLSRICQQKNLLASMGSDFHQHNGWQRLGMHDRLPLACKPVWDHFT